LRRTRPAAIDSDITGSMSALRPPSWTRKVACPTQVSASSAALRSARPSFGTVGTGTPVIGEGGRFSWCNPVFHFRIRARLDARELPSRFE